VLLKNIFEIKKKNPHQNYLYLARVFLFHLSDDTLTLLRRRIVVNSLFSWLPLLIFPALEGQVLGGRHSVSRGSCQ
jgi:hypothetical protein